MSKPRSKRPRPLSAGTRLPFEAATQPGCYVCEWSGHLLRVPEGQDSPHPPVVRLEGAETLWVTHISDDPSLPRRAAQVRAANMDLPVNF